MTGFADTKKQHPLGKAPCLRTYHQPALTPFHSKSLCFQLPALIDHGITIVVSPLLALMNNQVAALRAINIQVATINSNTLQSDRHDIFKDLCCGEVDR